MTQCEGVQRKTSLNLDLSLNGNLVFHPLNLDWSGCCGVTTVHAKIEIENLRGQRLTFANANHPGLTPAPLLIHFLSTPLPYPGDWYAGELHCHSDYSNDPVEFGAPLSVLQAAAQSLGLGYVVCTDHSYDFYYSKIRYMEPMDPDVNFGNYRADALALNGGTDASNLPIMIPGEEVSCGNHLGENVHLLVAGFPRFLPGLGDGGRRWLNNKPDLSVGEILEQIGATPAFAAHPRVRVGGLERFIFRRGMWHEQDVARQGARAVDGLQFWNGTRSSDFYAGREFWIKRLLNGERLSPIGANDAHGDLNQNVGVKTPLFSLYKNRNHIFGNVRTVVHAAEKSIVGIQAGLKSGRVVCTDGPFISLESCMKGVRVEARSTIDWGGLETVRIWGGQFGASGEIDLKKWSWREGPPFHVSEDLPLPAKLDYVRAETTTSEKKFAMTSPLYLD